MSLLLLLNQPPGGGITGVGAAVIAGPSVSGAGTSGPSQVVVDEGASTGVTFSTINVSGQDYRVATFAASGNLVVTTGGDVEYLVIAGGASGGYNRGGGGGAGGMLQGSTAIAAGTLPVVVGAGGAARSTSGPGNAGSGSSFAGVAPLGGGAGGSNNNIDGADGGSGGGGGGGDTSTPQAARGFGTSGQGGNGGNGHRNSTLGNRAGGGGGGAGTGASSASSGQGGNGGLGLDSDITGTTVRYAAGGPGFGATMGTTPAGAGNPGSGGAGAHTTDSFSGAGQNGIVIVRWPIAASGPSGAVSIGGPAVAGSGTVSASGITGTAAAQVAGPRAFGTGSIPLVGETLSVPSGWDGITPAFGIRRTGLRIYEHSFDVLGELAATDVTYYISPTGNDANSGLSPSSAKKSVNALVVALNASPPALGATIIIAPGTYRLGDALATNITFPCNLICENGRARFYEETPNAWFKVGGFTNVYNSGASSGSRTRVADLVELDPEGRPRRYRVVADLATCDATPGSIFAAGNSTNIHCFGSRVPDAGIVRFTGATSWTQTSPVRIYVQGVDFWGSDDRPVTWQPTGTNGRICFDRCSFRYSAPTSNGIEVPSGDASHRIIYFRCDASYNGYDGFSYRGSVTGYEIECRAEWNGFSRLNNADNGSTAHAFSRTLRINGIYAYNDDRNIHDIDTTRNWAIGCQAGFAQNGDTDTYLNTAFMAGRQTFGDNTLTWLDGCTSLGGVASDAAAYGTSIITAVDCAGLTVRVTDGTAAINLSNRDDSRTGSGAGSIGGPVASGAGTVGAAGITGAAAVAIVAPSLAATGTATPPAISGSAAVAIGGPLAAGTGTATPPAITGTAAVQIGAPVLSGTGTVAGPGVITGTAAVSIGGPSMAGAGTASAPSITGTGAANINGPLLAGSGTVGTPGVSGAGAVSIAAPVASGTGTATPPAITGTAAVVISGPIVLGSQAPNSAGRVAFPGESGNGGSLAASGNGGTLTSSRRGGRLV